jgi:hypothetical protein
MQSCDGVGLLDDDLGAGTDVAAAGDVGVDGGVGGHDVAVLPVV